MPQPISAFSARNAPILAAMAQFVERAAEIVSVVIRRAQGGDPVCSSSASRAHSWSVTGRAVGSRNKPASGPEGDASLQIVADSDSGAEDRG